MLLQNEGKIQNTEQKKKQNKKQCHQNRNLDFKTLFTIYTLSPHRITVLFSGSISAQLWSITVQTSYRCIRSIQG